MREKERKNGETRRRNKLRGWRGTIDAHGCLTAALWSPLVPRSRGIFIAAGLRCQRTTNGEQCTARHGWIIFHGFAYNSDAFTFSGRAGRIHPHSRPGKVDECRGRNGILKFWGKAVGVVGLFPPFCFARCSIFGRCLVEDIVRLLNEILVAFFFLLASFCPSNSI